MAFTENMLTRSYVTSAAVSQYRFIVMTSGLAAHVVTAGGTISKGAAVSSDATGKVITATTGHIIMGTALEAAVSGQVITVDLRLDGTAA